MFEHLRIVRRELAQQNDVPAFVIFSDATLRDMARKMPDTPASFRNVHGVGDAKLAQFGERFIGEITIYYRRQDGKRRGPVPLSRA